MSYGHMDDLLEHLQRCVDEYIFDVDGPGEWLVRGEAYDVDQNDVPDNGAAAVLVRRSDGARFEVTADILVEKLPGGAQ